MRRLERPGGPTPHHGAVGGGAASPYGVAASSVASVSPLDSVYVLEKIGGPVQVSSNSENISRLAFLEYKNSRKQELALWHLVNRLVPENA